MRSKIQRLLEKEITIEDLLENKDFIHSMPKEIYQVLMEHYDMYRHHKYSEEILRLELLLVLSQHSPNFLRFLELMEKIKITRTLNNNSTSNIVESN